MSAFHVLGAVLRGLLYPHSGLVVTLQGLNTAKILIVQGEN